MTFDPAGDGSPTWSPDGTKFVFGSNRTGDGAVNLYLKSSSGAGDDQLLFQAKGEKFPSSWSPDGRYIAFESWVAASKGAIWVLSTANDGQAKPLLQSNAFDQSQPQFSPDGRVIAYVSNESGRVNIYVQPYPLTGEKWQVSLAGGFYPRWRKDGKELFYTTVEGKLMSVDIEPGPKFESSVPRQLFQTAIKFTADGWSVAPSGDGQKFLVNAYASANNSAPMMIVLNWPAQFNQNN